MKIPNGHVDATVRLDKALSETALLGSHLPECFGIDTASVQGVFKAPPLVQTEADQSSKPLLPTFSAVPETRPPFTAQRCLRLCEQGHFESGGIACTLRLKE